ncbi:MAG: hypothetical protein OXI81_10790 [Paracoccaceae bacterium]|nr:hypothetical protein [Paracoccaceae bacterium]
MKIRLNGPRASPPGIAVIDEFKLRSSPWRGGFFRLAAWREVAMAILHIAREALCSGFRVLPIAHRERRTMAAAIRSNCRLANSRASCGLEPEPVREFGCSNVPITDSQERGASRPIAD